MSEFKVGDLIVYIDFYVEDLMKIDIIYEDEQLGFHGAKRSNKWFEGFTEKDTVRLATKEEIKAGRRLP